MKKCKKCDFEGENDLFRKTSNICKKCKAEYDKQYRIENIEKIKKYHKNYVKEYNIKNRKNKSKYNKEYGIKNKKKISEHKREYQYKNKDKILERQRKYYRNRKKNDIFFKLRRHVSRIINKHLKKNNSSKNGDSCLKYLPYTIEELKLYLESLFEPWMDWNNYGKYNPKTWKDDDISTWAWNIDHIIPQSDLPYLFMKDDNFRKCWALENLRPYSAKQNIIDGATRIRHKKENINEN